MPKTKPALKANLPQNHSDISDAPDQKCHSNKLLKKKQYRPDQNNVSLVTFAGHAILTADPLPESLGRANQNHQETAVESTNCDKTSTVILPGADQKKQEILGALISGITHEINTPMHYLENNLTFLKVAFKDMSRLLDTCQTLLAKVKSGENISESDWQNLVSVELETDPEYLKTEIGEALKQSLEGINMVSRLVLALKDFSHPSLHEISLTDINKCIDTVCTISRHEWKRVAELQLDLARDLPYLYGSRDELHQVLLNLIVNSAHAISEKIAAGKYSHGKIMIKTCCENDQIVVEVTDDGPGIPAENLELVFAPHFTTKEAGKGTGIGLSLVKRIVEQAHGGKICLTSDGKTGTSFKIILPHRRHEKSL